MLICVIRGCKTQPKFYSPISFIDPIYFIYLYTYIPIYLYTHTPYYTFFPYALCPMPYALCSMLYALCPILYVLCPIPKKSVRVLQSFFNTLCGFCGSQSFFTIKIFFQKIFLDITRGFFRYK